MTVFEGFGSNKWLVAVSAVATLGLVVAVFWQSGDTPPVVGGSPVQVNAPSVPAKAATKAATDLKTDAGIAPIAGNVTDTLATDPLVENPDVAVGQGSDGSIATSDGGNTVVASTDPAETVSLATSSAAKPKVGDASAGILQAGRLKFDLVRVDKFGSAVVAGKAVPGRTVKIQINGDVIAETVADKRGAFVALFDIPASADPQVITLLSEGQTGEISRSSDRVVVMGRKVVKPASEPDAAPSLPVDEVAPAVIIASDEGIKVVQPATIDSDAPEVMANVTLDLISYDARGEVILTGRGNVDQHVRVYVNDKPVTTEPVGPDGSWQLSLPDVDAGRYTLRVDEIDGKGQVTSRFETPFQKEKSTDVMRVVSSTKLGEGSGPSKLPVIEKVTIQPGATLWALAEANYGQGDLYMLIFQANRDTIRNPDLIYPGQIFTIPE